MAKDVKTVETVGFLSAAVALMTITLMNAGTAFAQQPGLAGTSARPESTNSVAAIASRRSIREIVSELRRFHGESRSERDVPPGVSRNLTELKHALRDLIVEAAGAPNAIAADPDDLASRVIERLEREDVPVGDQGGYGTIPAIKFRRPPGYSSWLVVTTTLAIPYGDDTSLYLFETDGTSWRPVLTLESNGYKEISGAQGWLTYYVAPPVSGKRPYLVTADVTPSDVSVWQGLRVKVLQVGKKPEEPIVRAKRTLGYCLDDSYYVSIRPDGFGLIFLGYSVDRELAGWRGVHYLEGTVSEKSASLKEIAVDPYNFMNRWSAYGWIAASRLVDVSPRDSLREWHQRFRLDRWTCGLGATSLGHRDGNRLFAVSECVRYDHTDPEAYVTLSAGRDGFRIASIASGKPTLTETSGETVYFAGGSGITDPIPETIVRPKLPPSIPPPATPLKVRLGVVVSEDGTVGDVSVLDWPDDQYRIVVPAIQAAKHWTYKPGSLNGNPVKISTHVEVVFEP